jgi:hypothetical protein
MGLPFGNHERDYCKVPGPLRSLRSYYPVGFALATEPQGCHREDRYGMPESPFDTPKE